MTTTESIEPVAASTTPAGSPRTGSSPFTVEFQAEVFRYLVGSPQAMANFETVIRPSFFTDEGLVTLWGFALAHWRLYHTVPSLGIVSEMVRRGYSGDQHHREALSKRMHEVYSIAMTSAEAIEDRLREFIGWSAIKAATMASIEDLEAGRYNPDIVLKFQEAVRAAQFGTEAGEEHPAVPEEQVVGVDTANLLQYYGRGVVTISNRELSALGELAYSMSRKKAEEDSSFRQLIPYTVITNKDGLVLTYLRGKVGQEPRLHAKRSLGVGGHIGPDDESISAAVLRELKEEVSLDENDFGDIGILAVIDDVSDAVSRVHLGILCTVDLAVDEVPQENFEECLVDPKFMTIYELVKRRHEFEAWSQLVICDMAVQAGLDIVRARAFEAS